MKNICYILSGINTALAFEWINEQLDPQKFKLHFILLHHSKGGFEEYLIKSNTSFIRIDYRDKKDIVNSTYKTFQFLKKNKIEIVHSHLLDAGIVGSLAAKMAGIKTRIYTRHYSTYHHIFHPKGVYYDRLINKLNTHLIAVSKVVKDILIEKENVDESKIQIIHHGFPLEKFDLQDITKKSALQELYKTKGKYPVIGVIARYTKWKGIQYIIPAFAEILKKYPNAHLVLANANGDFKASIKSKLDLLPKENYTEIAFEKDLFTLFHCFDVFVHTPIDEHSEAFGQVYVEAMASGIPSVFTKSGIGNEIILHNKNAILVPYQNSKSITEAILSLIENQELRNAISKEAKLTVEKDFSLSKMIQKLTNLYE